MENAIVPEQEVREQLARILADDIFVNSSILHDFLSYIVEETLEGKSNTLKEYTIGTSVLSKKTTYDPQSDASVRIHAGRLRKALSAYYSGKGKNDPLLITVPKGSYVPQFSFNTPTTYKAVADGQKLYNRPTLAVMPFHVYDRERDEALADGLCDQLSTDFTAFSEITVISYYSMRRIAGQYDDLRKLGQLLDVNYILTGNIQSSQEDIRIRVQLNVANTLEQVWAGTYERKRGAFDTFSLQDDIVKHVINRIAGSMGVINQVATRLPSNQKLLDVKVYDAVFWFYYLVREKLDEATVNKAISSMREAVRLDPNYAMGWAVLAETCVAGHFYGYNCGDDSLDSAVSYGKKALQIDRNCHHAYQSLALAYIFRHEKENCLAIAREWRSLHTNVASIEGGIGFCLVCCGEYEQGYQMLTDSMHLNPFYPWWFNAGLVFYHLKKEEFNEAIFWAEKLHDYTPAWEWLIKTTALAEAGREKEAREAYRMLYTLLPADQTEPTIRAFLQDPAIIEMISDHCIKKEAV